ncbi:MAG TPA: DUF1934 domain-containing protein [Candidatus Blautia pullicola]|jgi:uncharacterized beta-barrel protein YwiB (DUF1934 family)|uniref:DUF1934 domain-containing protein n=1 Tax=Candidatus Blautia pullicola TaxID=2838498 RepID=A0A9D2JRJ4_9FIRM|nr:DUF1934 domain-containing protein [Candidatus Blautia pullicola]
MTKDVLVTIKGVQSLEDIEEQEDVEVVAKGDYYYRNGHHFIMFDEMSDEDYQTTKNTIKITEKSVEVRRKGAANVQMIFEENKKNLTYYATPFGNLQMAVAATKIDFKEKEESLDLIIDYALEINSQHAADCQISLCVRPKAEGCFSL